MSSSITTTKNTKTAQAYSVGGQSSARWPRQLAPWPLSGVQGVRERPAAPVSLAPCRQLGAALFGPIKEENDSTADGTKQLQSELSLVSNILTAVDSSTTSERKNRPGTPKRPLPYADALEHEPVSVRERAQTRRR